MRLMILTVLAAAALLSCDPGLTRQQRGVQEQVLRERVAAWARHMNNQALDSLAPFYDHTPDLISVWPSGDRYVGWEAEGRAQRDLFRAVSTLNLVVQDPRTRLMGWGNAVVTFRFSTDQYLRSDVRDVYSGHGTQVWIRDRENPEWRMLVSQMSRTPFGPTEQAARR